MRYRPLSNADATTELMACKGFTRLTPEEQQAAIAQYARCSPRERAYLLVRPMTATGGAAALKAGFSQKIANPYAVVLWRKLQPTGQLLMRAYQQEMAAQSGVSRERWLQEIQRLAFYDTRKWFDAHGKPVEVSGLDPDSAAVLAGFEVEDRMNGKGELAGSVKRYRLADKLKALELFGKATGYLVERHDHRYGFLDEATTETLLEMKAQAEARVSGPTVLVSQIANTAKAIESFDEAEQRADVMGGKTVPA